MRRHIGDTRGDVVETLFLEGPSRERDHVFVDVDGLDRPVAMSARKRLAEQPFGAARVENADRPSCSRPFEGLLREPESNPSGRREATSRSVEAITKRVHRRGIVAPGIARPAAFKILPGRRPAARVVRGAGRCAREA